MDFNDDFFDNSDDIFGDSSDSGEGFDQLDSSSETGSRDSSNDDFSGAFDDNTSEDESNSETKTTKASILIAAAGILLFIIISIIAIKVTSGGKDSDVKQETVNTQEAVEDEKRTEKRTEKETDRDSKDVSNIMNSGNKDKENNKSKNETKTDSNGWVEIDNKQEIKFNKNKKELIFTVTKINHFAKKVGVNDNLVIKTTLTGSLSGLTGSYSLDVPYSKGSKLVVGDEFTVLVELGTYNKKTVVGEISY